MPGHSTGTNPPHHTSRCDITPHYTTCPLKPHHTSLHHTPHPAPPLPQGSVVVIRYEGPKGGPGMPEMLTPTSAIMGAGLGQECALITDGRFRWVLG